MTSDAHLSEMLDRWATSGGVAITETDRRLVVNQLSGQQALDLAAAVDGTVGWPNLAFSDAGGDLPRDQLTPRLSGIRAELNKPPAPADVELILTNTAFAASLSRARTHRRYWVRGLTAPFETREVRYGPWGDDVLPSNAEAASDPRKVVRPLGDYPDDRADLGRWLLRDPTGSLPLGDNAFLTWRREAAAAAATALANEVEPDGRLMFRGPPVGRYSIDGAAALKDSEFEALQRAAAFAYENPRELENRQNLVAAEIARAGVAGGDLVALAQVAGPALEGARIAYNFGVTGQSRDTLKALSDLRKAVMDETAKVAENTRGLAAAVAGAVFGNIGLIVARLSLTPNNVFVPQAAAILGIVLAAYVGLVIASGLHFLRLQHDLRVQWRSRLYRFLTDADYEDLVARPVRRAERGFYAAAVVGGVLAALLLVATLWIAGTAPVVTPPLTKPVHTIDGAGAQASSTAKVLPHAAGTQPGTLNGAAGERSARGTPQPTTTPAAPRTERQRVVIGPPKE